MIKNVSKQTDMLAYSSIKKTGCIGNCDQDVVKQDNNLVLTCRTCKKICKVIKKI